jgi:protein-disulfide isomerase
MNKQFAAIIAVVIIGMVGIFALTSNKTSAPSGGNNSSTSGSNHVVGAGKKNVTLIEYGDLQCPACKSYYPLVKEIKNTYGDDIKFQFKHFPLVQIHRHAMIAARAAEAAGNQGKFWEMHDLMYENQDTWSPSQDPTSTFEGYASQLGLKLDQFKTDMTSEAVASAINADIKAGQALKANSTPTFVINGKKVEKNPQSLDEFKKLIDDAGAKQN